MRKATSAGIRNSREAWSIVESSPFCYAQIPGGLDFAMEQNICIHWVVYLKCYSICNSTFFFFECYTCSQLKAVLAVSYGNTYIGTCTMYGSFILSCIGTWVPSAELAEAALPVGTMSNERPTNRMVQYIHMYITKYLGRLGSLISSCIYVTPRIYIYKTHHPFIRRILIAPPRSKIQLFKPSTAYTYTHGVNMATKGNKTTHLPTVYTPLLNKPLESSNPSSLSTTPAPVVDLVKPAIEKDLEAQTSTSDKTGDKTGASNIEEDDHMFGVLT